MTARLHRMIQNIRLPLVVHRPPVRSAGRLRTPGSYPGSGCRSEHSVGRLFRVISQIRWIMVVDWRRGIGQYDPRAGGKTND